MSPIIEKCIVSRTRLLQVTSLFVVIAFGALSTQAAGPCGIYGSLCGASGNAAPMSLAQAQTLTSAGVGWIRCGMTLPSGMGHWSDVWPRYDTAVNNARAAGLDIIMLLNNQSWHGGESNWDANAFETTGRNGTNQYITDFINNAVIPIVQRYHDRVKIFEIWNEPWDKTVAFIQPSCLAQLQTSAWIATHVTLGLNDVKIIIGDGHDGAYLNSVYTVATNSTVDCFRSAKSKWGTYPVDGFAQHVYIDAGTTTTSDHLRSYINGLRGVVTAWEGGGTPKGTYITEFGWNAYYIEDGCQFGNPVAWTTAQAIQSENLRAAFSLFNVGATGAYVKCACWFDWQDGPQGSGCANNDAGQGFGLLDVHGSRKSSYGNFHVANLYEGRTSVGGAIDSNILNYFSGHGGQATLGNPYDNGANAFVHRWAVGSFSGNVQDFDGGQSGLKLIVFSSALGTFQVNNLHGFWDFYVRSGGINKFGAPKNDANTVSGITRQDFQNGFFTDDATNGVVWHP